jgi:hypothetical protein
VANVERLFLPILLAPRSPRNRTRIERRRRLPALPGSFELRLPLRLQAADVVIPVLVGLLV